MDLRYVTSTAASCDLVWTVGAVLPVDYEWCQDEDGEPVSGVRIGSCEVVLHGADLYAAPGRRITAVRGSVELDPAYLDSLTSCKRKPYETENQ